MWSRAMQIHVLEGQSNSKQNCLSMLWTDGRGSSNSIFPFRPVLDCTYCPIQTAAVIDIGTRHTKSMWSLQLLRYSKLDWTQSGATALVEAA